MQVSLLIVTTIFFIFIQYIISFMIHIEMKRHLKICAGIHSHIERYMQLHIVIVLIMLPATTLVGLTDTEKARNHYTVCILISVSLSHYTLYYTYSHLYVI